MDTGGLRPPGIMLVNEVLQNEMDIRGLEGRIAMERELSNRGLVQTIFDAINKRDLAEFEQYLSEGAVFDFPGPGRIEGQRRILLFFKILFRKYPRLRFTVEDIIVEGDQACAIWSNEGEEKKGGVYRNRGVTHVRSSEGKIVFISDYFKDTSFVEN